MGHTRAKLNTKLSLEFQFEYGFKLEFQVELSIIWESEVYGCQGGAFSNPYGKDWACG